MRVKNLGLLVCLILGCQQQVVESESSRLSSEHLKVGLLAIDRGELIEAQSELKAALQYDPFNSRAVTALSSVYASEAGVSLRSWLDPFWESSRQLDARVKYFESSVGTFEELTRLMSISDEQKASQERIRAIVGAGAHATLGLSILLDVFKTVPYLDDVQLEKLEVAIQTLRIEGLSAQNWDEEQRVYLAVLSMVRLINHVRRIAGDSMNEMHTLIDRLCQHKPDFIAKEVGEIKRSLRYLEEGLIVSPRDPMTSQRAGRVRFQQFISKALSDQVWADLTNLFDNSTPDGQMAEGLSQQLCHPTSPTTGI